IWETSLNLHWIECDPEPRAQDFCNFTVMEMRKIVQKTGGPLADFDQGTQRLQSRFRFRDSRGRDRSHDNFSTATIHKRADILGEPWKPEYQLVYHMSSMHAHGGPGAILHQHFRQHSSAPQESEKQSTALIAYLSMKTIVQDVHLLVRQGFVS